ncbi:hypothetical protein LX32DRAFT_113362 [Colletotrichum zoysiae]|uniref:Uncharacterized protein n=1 Tax=Colletotrichum zoysiae TaxID=1216348 RepID=A0AAD9LWY2_9PEZI|nr:hypothetical protein LX32DRAFT_113362 [Colletotrichum zoysiae]
MLHDPVHCFLAGIGSTYLLIPGLGFRSAVISLILLSLRVPEWESIAHLPTRMGPPLPRLFCLALLPRCHYMASILEPGHPATTPRKKVSKIIRLNRPAVSNANSGGTSSLRADRN